MAEEVNISSEKEDCIKVYCKRGVEKQTRGKKKKRDKRHSQDINGFAWLSNGKYGGWIRMQA
ncbi:MAG: hypothetical protein ABI347_09265 [Nitrososphaera sp.]|jgi:hypothetical protein